MPRFKEKIIMADNRVAGIFYFKKDGKIIAVKGSWTYNLGQPKREAVLDSTGKNQGYKEIPQVAFMEGDGINTRSLDLVALLNTTGATGTLELANGKVIVLRNAYHAGEGNVGTEDSNVALRFEGDSAEEIR